MSTALGGQKGHTEKYNEGNIPEEWFSVKSARGVDIRSGRHFLRIVG